MHDNEIPARNFVTSCSRITATLTKLRTPINHSKKLNDLKKIVSVTEIMAWHHMTTIKTNNTSKSPNVQQMEEFG
jgi:hypothetical protein